MLANKAAHKSAPVFEENTSVGVDLLQDLIHVVDGIALLPGPVALLDAFAGGLSLLGSLLRGGLLWFRHDDLRYFSFKSIFLSFCKGWCSAPYAKGDTKL